MLFQKTLYLLCDKTKNEGRWLLPTRPPFGGGHSPAFSFLGKLGAEVPFWFVKTFHNPITQRSVSYIAANTYMYLQLSHYFWIRHSKKGVKIHRPLLL